MSKSGSSVTRLHLHLTIEAGGISGDAVDDTGRIWTVDGWLGLIGLVNQLSTDAAPQHAPPDAPQPRE